MDIQNYCYVQLIMPRRGMGCGQTLIFFTLNIQNFKLCIEVKIIIIVNVNHEPTQSWNLFDFQAHIIWKCPTKGWNKY